MLQSLFNKPLVSELNCRHSCNSALAAGTLGKLHKHLLHAVWERQCHCW